MGTRGEGVTRNVAKAVAWLEKAADRGSLCAQYDLGVKNREGGDVVKDMTKSIRWLGKAAQQQGVVCMPKEQTLIAAPVMRAL